ncbi:MAG: hypothetical protein [Caudovirales sp. ctOwN3]|nr:MAG: hypothetical protein [Caudovirales sp. ctOwN3]
MFGRKRAFTEPVYNKTNKNKTIYKLNLFVVYWQHCIKRCS